MEKTYERLRDIPQFPHAPYSVNVPWKGIDSFLESALYVNLDPEYQRGFVWTQDQRERYIEYRLRGGRSGKIIYWNCPNWHRSQGNMPWHDTLELVDGKQRLKAVDMFLRSQVKVFGKYLNEYPDQKSADRIGFADFEFHVNNLASKREVVEWYLGLNNGGTAHSDEDLNIARNVLKELI